MANMTADEFIQLVEQMMSPADDADRFCPSCEGAFYSDDPDTLGGTACPNCDLESLVVMDDDLRRRARASEMFEGVRQIVREELLNEQQIGQTQFVKETLKAGADAMFASARVHAPQADAEWLRQYFKDMLTKSCGQHLWNFYRETVQEAQDEHGHDSHQKV